MGTALGDHINDTTNPHLVTFTQSVDADSLTDITAAEAEQLTDGSNADSLHIHRSYEVTHDPTWMQDVIVEEGLTPNELDVGNALDWLYNEITTTIDFLEESSQYFYVSKIGDDNNTGSMSYPFLTVQRGIDAAAAEFASSGSYCVVIIMPGTYAENLTLSPYVALWAYGKEPTRIGTNSGSHTLTFDTSGRTYYRGINFRLDTFTITHTPASGGSISVWLEDCSVGAMTMNGLGWNDYLQFRGDTYVFEKLTVHAAHLSFFDGETQITTGTGDIQIEIDSDGAETYDTTSNKACTAILRDIEVANNILIEDDVEVWMYNTATYGTITIDASNCNVPTNNTTILHVDNSSAPEDRSDVILVDNLPTTGGEPIFDLLDYAYTVGYDDSVTSFGVDNVQDAIQAVANQIVQFEMPSGTAFPTSPAPDAGDIFYRTDLNMTFQYDGSRSKWLSMTQMFLDWGANVADGKYLRIHGATATQTGYLMPYSGTIISLTAKIASGNQSKAVEIRRNNDRVTPLESVTLTSGSYSSTLTNVDFDAGDYLQAFVPSAGTPAKDIVVMAVVVWNGF